jgi:hypothetical protein
VRMSRPMTIAQFGEAVRVAETRNSVASQTRIGKTAMSAAWRWVRFIVSSPNHRMEHSSVLGMGSWGQTEGAVVMGL